MIKPIETQYAGCRFRSRLEARWAVFFDAAAIPWLYEPEGYELSDGRRYLPDFYLPECDTWIEVKGSASNLDLTLIELAAMDIPAQDCPCERGPRLMLLGPIPELRHDGMDFGWSSIEEYGDGQWYWGHSGFGLYPKNGRPWGMPLPDPSPVITAAVGDETMKPVIANAYSRARKARFEHGDRP